VNRIAHALFAIVFIATTSPIQAAEELPKPEPLWPKGAPLAKGMSDRDIPALFIWQPAPENSVGAAVVVLPGGGYGNLAMDHEGKQIAAWLNKQGISAFVLRYRHAPGYQHPVPLMDAQRAVRWVRAHATDYKIDPKKVGIWGFSAGGHLASTVSTHFDAGKQDAENPIDRFSSRPDFSILCYPLISMKESFAHVGSKKNLLGENPDPALVEDLSNETKVTAETPPTFIFHTDADKAVLADHVIVYYSALRKAGVPTEMHIYEKGPHGVGLAPADPILSTWSGRLRDWLSNRGILPKPKKS
jgi:acetyl esterase/lipase